MSLLVIRKGRISGTLHSRWRHHEPCTYFPSLSVFSITLIATRSAQIYNTQHLGSSINDSIEVPHWVNRKCATLWRTATPVHFNQFRVATVSMAITYLQHTCSTWSTWNTNLGRWQSMAFHSEPVAIKAFTRQKKKVLDKWKMQTSEEKKKNSRHDDLGEH